jgi:hypothetical protein
VEYCEKEVVFRINLAEVPELAKHKLNKDRTDYTQYPVIFYFLLQDIKINMLIWQKYLQ